MKQEILASKLFLLYLVLVQSLSSIWLFATPWTVAHQAPLSMGFPRQEYWSEVAISFFRRSSWPRDQTQVSRIGRWILYHWATRASLYTSSKHLKNKLHNCIIIPRNTCKELGEINLHRKYRIFYKLLLKEISAFCTHMCMCAHVYGWKWICWY